MKNLAFFISGTGGNALNLLKACKEGRLVANPVLAVASTPRAKGIERLRDAGMLVMVLEKGSASDADYSTVLFGMAEAAEVDFICLAGWLKKLVIPASWEGRVVNIHPSLLPRHGGLGMYGMHVHRSVLAAGDGESGCTVHLVDNEFDHGGILAQACVPVLPGDTAESLQERVYAKEMELYPDTLQNLVAS